VGRAAAAGAAVRTPHGKEPIITGTAGVPFDIVRAVQTGYLVVSQNVRGRTPRRAISSRTPTNPVMVWT
jgi:hypothetical protein